MEQEILDDVVKVKKEGNKLYIVGNNYNYNNKEVTATGSDTPRTLADRFVDVVNVKDFGAVGDGVTDDTEAIQKAFDAGKGKTVFIPSGIYIVSKTLIAKTGSSVIGSGKIDYWGDNFTLGTVLKTVGSGNPSKWTDIYEGDETQETPLLIAGGNGVYFDNFTLITETTPWSIGLFFPSVKQCGYSRITALGFTNSPIYLDVTWSDRNTYLKNIHPEIETSQGMNEFYGEDFIAIGVNEGIKIKGTTRDPDLYETDNWVWGWGGASDVVFCKGRASGLVIDAAIKGNSAKTVQGQRFICVDFHIGNRTTMISIDRANRVDFISGYGEASSGITPQMHFSSNTRYVNFLYSSYNSHVYVDGSEIGTFGDAYISDKISYISHKGRFCLNGLFYNGDTVRYYLDNFLSLGTSTYNFNKVNTRIVSSNSTSLSLGSSEGTDFQCRNDVNISYRTTRPSDDNSLNLGTGSYRWGQLYAATDSINTSDADAKQNIEAYPDAVLDAWGEVELRQFLFKDAVAKKGAAARIHAGVIAQQVVQAFKDKGLDATQYGLLCYDEWPDEYETVEVVDVPAVLDEDGNEVTPAQTHTEQRLVTRAGSRYGIRYSEALCIEAAYQRRRADNMESRIKELESKLSELEELIKTK